MGNASQQSMEGVEEDAEDLVSERELFGTDDEEEDFNEKDLFGSEDEAEATGAPADAVPLADAQPPSRAGTEEPDDLDEEDIFGKLSDEEEAGERTETEEMVVRKRPLPPANRSMAALRPP